MKIDLSAHEARKNAFRASGVFTDEVICDFFDRNVSARA